MSYEELRSRISAMNFPKPGKYSAKLGFDQRCEILALYRTGVSRVVLADAYGLDRRTVTHIYNPSSPHYRNVREEEAKLGRELFLQTYITENAIDKLNKVAKPDKPITIDMEHPNRPTVRRGATKYAGVHYIKTSATDFEHRIMIGWCEATLDNAGAGWYYRDADGPYPETWLHNGDDSRVSSLACLEAVKENLVDV